MHENHEANKQLVSTNSILKKSYLMFPRTLDVPPHGGEKYMIIACIISHVAAQMKLYMLIACIFFLNRIKVDAYRRVGGGFDASTLLCAWFLMQLRNNTWY